MGWGVRHAIHRGDLKPTAAALLKEPLDFIHAVHFREREICASLDKIAENGAVETKVIEEVMDFLSNALPLHLKDEEEDLFPLLKRRCLPEDDIGKIIARLCRDHTYAHEDTPKILALLEGLVEKPRPLDGVETGALAAYAGHGRRHLILENAIILPFAHLRLTAGDLETLGIRMCQRRGLTV